MTLLKELQDITERTYRAVTGINLEEFVIGRRRFQDLSRLCAAEVQELSDAARVFFRVLDGRLYMAIYFSKEVIALLEENDPRRGLSEKNIEPFMVFVEEINHGVHAALKFSSGEREVADEAFIRDLELLAKIDTYQVLKFFVAYFNASRQLENFDRLWLRFHLFERGDYSYESRVLAERYLEVNRLGEKFTRFLDTLPPEHRLAEIRRFRRLPYPAKTRYIRMLP